MTDFGWPLRKRSKLRGINPKRLKKAEHMSRPEEQDSFDEYNYKAFTRSESAGKSGEFKISLRAGEEAPDFELATAEGERIRLSKFRGKQHVLLEFGSIT
jgi:hypothetical protein